MLENGRKTIGVFISRMVDYFQKTVCYGIERRCQELNYNTIVFSLFGDYAKNTMFAKGEAMYSELPDYSRLDGAIIAPDTFDMPEVYEETVRRLKKECNGPVVSIRGEGGLDYHIVVDNEHCMDELLRHFIEYHGYKDICFLTGHKGMIDAEERLDSYKRIMTEYGLPFDEGMYYYGDFWKGSGKKACDYFIDKRGKVPEAICCANDYMGITVCHELSERGYRVPEDIAVCGYDGVWESKVSVPSLSTANVNFEEMGRAAVDAIDGKYKNHTIYFPSEMVVRDSCGCIDNSRIEELKSRNEFYYKYDFEKQQSTLSTFQAMAIEASGSREEIAMAIQRYLHMIEGCQEFYVCLQDHMLEQLDSVSYGEPMSEYMELAVSVDADNKDIKKEVLRFQRKYLLPGEYIKDEPMILYVIPFHYRERNLGYTVATMNEKSTGGYPTTFQSFIVSIGNAFQDLFNQMKMNKMIDSLEELSIHDPMTGIYNRYGFEEEGRIIFEKAKLTGGKIFFLSVDLDGLKKINDTWGHAAGDFAICTTTNSLKRANKHNAVIARMGGDEFNVVGECTSEKEVTEFIRTFEKYMSEEDKKHEYKIQASLGKYILEPGSDTSWEECLLISDNRMYAVKRSSR